MKLQAFHNNSQLQKEFLVRVQGHYDADEIIHGVYWKKGKGCGIGCMIHSSLHKDLESLYGIPEWISRLIDVLFEEMEHKHSKEFVLEFAKIVCEKSFLGFDNWQHIYHQLCVFMLENICKDIDKYIDNKTVVKIICDIITLHKRESKDESAWSAAASAAWFTTDLTVRFNAGSAAESAAKFTAKFTVTSAESAAASAVASAARFAAASAAWFAADLTTKSTTKSTTRFAAASATRLTAYKSITDKFLELLKKETK